MKNKVSVIISCYNALQFLEDTLESVFSQSYSPIEVIVIDDDSTDGSIAYLKSLDHPNFIIKPNKGKGACAARNYGLELATGDYIQFLDADDLLSTNKIKDQVQLLEKNPHCIAVCSTVHFYDQPENGRIVDKPFMVSTDEPGKFLLNLYGGDGKNHGMIQTGSWLTPKHLIDKSGLWNETLHKDQDGEFFCRVVMQSNGVYYTPECQCFYRKHIGGRNIANQKKRRHLESQLQALASKMHQLKEYKNSKSYSNAFALQHKILAINAYPDYIEIHNKAIKIVETLGGSTYVPVLGGKIIEGIKSVLGWRIAKLFSIWIHKFY